MLSEKQFLIGLALRRFNEQFTKTIRTQDCDIKSIPLRYGFERSYEIFTNRLDDSVRLHMHVCFEGLDGLSKYRVEVDSIQSQLPGSSGSLSDEVYVTTGTIDPYYIHNGIYRFRPINEDPTLIPILLQEFGEEILLENGDQINLEVSY